MDKMSKWIVKYRNLILAVAIILLIQAQLVISIQILITIYYLIYLQLQNL